MFLSFMPSELPMSITKRQFTQLQDMGIELWQLKDSSEDNNKTTATYLDIELSSLIETRLFNDILSSLGLSIGEVTCDNHSLSLGLFTWQFSEQTEISFTQQHLITPTFDTLKNSPKLKKALWHTLQEHSLI